MQKLIYVADVSTKLHGLLSYTHPVQHVWSTVVRHDICRHNCTVERWPADGFCGQLHHYNWPYYPAVWFRSSLSVVVSAEPFSDRSRPMPCNSSQMGPCWIIDMQLWPATDYEPYRGRGQWTKFNGGLQLPHKAEDDSVKWLESIATTAFTKWMKQNCCWNIPASQWHLFCFCYEASISNILRWTR